MKVLMIAPKTKTFVNFRGDLIKDIRKKHYDVTVIVPEKDCEDFFKENGVKVRYVNLNKNSLSIFNTLSYYNSLKKIIKEEKPDKVFSYTIKPVIFGSLAAKKARVKEIYSLICGLGYLFSVDTLKVKFLRTICGVAYKKALKVNTKVIFQNNDDIDEFVKRGYVKRGKCELVNGSGVNLEKFKKNKLPQKVSFIMVSRVLKEKGVLEYFKAAEKVKEKYPDVKFMYIGAIDKNKNAIDMDTLNNYIDKRIVEYISETNNVAGYVEKSSVFVLPSYYREGIPKTLIEATAMGRPIITTNTPGCRETVIDMVNGLFVKKKNISDLVDKMIYMIENKDKLQEMGNESYKLCLEKFTIDIINGRMMEIMGITDEPLCKDTIIYMGGFELPDKNAAAIRVTEIIKILKSLNKCVVTLGVNKSTKNGSFIIKDKKFMECDNYSIEYPNTKKQWFKYLTSSKDIIKIIDKYSNVQGVILYNFPSISMFKIMKYCRRKGIKVYGDITEWYLTSGHGLIFRILKGFDVSFRMKYLNKKMDGLILISDYLMRYYANCKNKVYVPVLTDVLNPKWENNWVKNSKKIRLVYAGNIENKDNINIVIRALNNVKRDYVYDIIGISREQYINKYPEMLNYLNSKIVFHGKLENIETLEYIKKANYTIFFRKKNIMTLAGFPSKLVESLSCGTPVITNSTSNVSMYFTNGENGICIDNFDEKIISELIEKVKLTTKINICAFDYNNYINDISRLIN